MFRRRKKTPVVPTVAESKDEEAIKRIQAWRETAKVIPWESPGYRDSWQRSLEDSATSITG